MKPSSPTLYSLPDGYSLVNRDETGHPDTFDPGDRRLFYWEKLGGWIKVDGYSPLGWYVEANDETIEKALAQWVSVAQMMDEQEGNPDTL
jgi:hypothetical protein